MSRQATLGLKGSCIVLKLTRRVVKIDIGLLSVYPGGSRMADLNKGLRTLYLFTIDGLSNIG